MKTESKKTVSPIRIFTDGAGCRPDGKGSGFAWLREDTGQKAIHRKDGLTNNQAEYCAILAAVESLKPGECAEVLTDSENTCFQLRGERRVRDPHLAELNAQIHAVIQKNGLLLNFTWVPRRENRAGKLI
jgi:ribonuclease HI